MNSVSDSKEPVVEATSTKGKDSTRHTLLIVVATTLALTALFLIKMSLNSRGNGGIDLEGAIEEVAELIKTT